MSSRFVAANESDPLLGSSRPVQLSYSAASLPRKSKSGPHCCTVCCTILSIISAVFLIFVGIYASSGWNYQQGGWSRDEIWLVQKNSFSAASLWILTGVISIWFWKQSMQPHSEYGRRPHDD